MTRGPTSNLPGSRKDIVQRPTSGKSPTEGVGTFRQADPLAYSIGEFCRRHGISRAHFYNLSKIGEGPVVMRVGRRTLVSAEAAMEWRVRMERSARQMHGQPGR